MSSSHTIDEFVGRRLRETRLRAGLNETELASLAEISLIDLHNFEEGNIRVHARLLLKFANILRVGLADFFKPAPVADDSRRAPQREPAAARPRASNDNSEDNRALLEAFHAIENKDARKEVLDLLEFMTEANKNNNTRT